MLPVIARENVTGYAEEPRARGGYPGEPRLLSDDLEKSFLQKVGRRSVRAATGEIIQHFAAMLFIELFDLLCVGHDALWLVVP